MLVRASVVAVAVLFTGMVVYSMNPRETYNEMYPADGLKRDAFGLCHQTDQTFVRAIRSDRIGCYDRMPNSFAMAIGWARHGTGFAAPPPPSFGTLETADLFLADVSRRASRVGDRANPMAISRPCDAPPAGAVERSLAAADGAAPAATSRPQLTPTALAMPPPPLARLASSDRGLPIPVRVGPDGEGRSNAATPPRLAGGLPAGAVNGDAALPTLNLLPISAAGVPAASPTPEPVSLGCPSRV